MFGNSATGSINYGLADVTATINSGAGFADILIQSKTAPRLGQEGFFMEFFTNGNVGLAQGAFFEYTKPSLGINYYYGGSSNLTTVPLTVSAVPVPAAIWLFTSALSGLFFFGKRRFA